LSPPRRVQVGRVSKPHGLAGEVVVSGSPLTVAEFSALEELAGRDAQGGLRRLVIASARPFLHNLLVCFQDVEDRDAAAELAGLALEADPDRLPRLEPGQVYIFELIGLAVATVDGESLGRVHDVMRTGATPILVVREELPPDSGKPRERLIPMSPDALVEVDVEAGRIVVRLLPGMADL